MSAYCPMGTPWTSAKVTSCTSSSLHLHAAGNVVSFLVWLVQHTDMLAVVYRLSSAVHSRYPRYVFLLQCMRRIRYTNYRLALSKATMYASC